MLSSCSYLSLFSSFPFRLPTQSLPWYACLLSALDGNEETLQWGKWNSGRVAICSWLPRRFYSSLPDNCPNILAHSSSLKSEWKITTLQIWYCNGAILLCSVLNLAAIISFRFNPFSTIIYPKFTRICLLTVIFKKGQRLLQSSGFDWI